MINREMVNKQCPARDRMSVERRAASFILRGMPAAFHVIDNAPRETYRGDYVSACVSSLRDGRRCALASEADINE
ncbi:MAG: hypothetical protein LBK94_05155 [Prevotellaceae bacterium]|jgi:hypothetical protein|nr:hypothetical protein [Prevotellaceae bacterium]